MSNLNLPWAYPSAPTPLTSGPDASDTRRVPRLRATAAVSFALATSALACAHRPAGADGAPLWFEVKSPHFVVRAATTESAARAAALSLERVRDGMLASTWHAAQDPLPVVQVILLADHTALQEFHYPREIQGARFADPFDRLLLVASVEDGDDVPVLKHELAHAVSHAFLLREPLWLAEGFASYMETLKLTKDSVTVGASNHDRLEDAVRARFPLEALLTAGPEVVQQRDERVSLAFYGRAWLLFHLLSNRHRKGLDGFIERLARAEEPGAAFAAAFGGLTPALLERELADYVNGGSYSTSTFPLPPTVAPLEVRALTGAERGVAQAQLWQVGLQFRPLFRPEATESAARALALDPGDPVAIGVWAEVSKAAPEARAAAARAATALRPDDFRGWLLLAEALREKGGEEHDRAALEAVRLAPQEARALLALARVRLFQGKYAEAVAAAREAVRRAPGRPEPLDLLATGLADSDDCAAAVSTERRALEVLPDRTPPEVVAEVTRRIGELGDRCARNVRRKMAPVQPKLLACTAGIPRLPLGKAGRRLEVHLHYKVRADGSVSDVSADPGPPPELIRGLVGHVGSCRYRPATQAGVPIDLQMEEVFRVAR